MQVAGDSGIEPAIVYAMNKAGRIVTETNVPFLTDAELQEWNDAVDEYHQKVEAGDPMGSLFLENAKSIPAAFQSATAHPQARSGLTAKGGPAI